jgi:hypothetical protein
MTTLRSSESTLPAGQPCLRRAVRATNSTWPTSRRTRPPSPRRTGGGVRGLLRHLARGSGRRQQLDRAAGAEQPPPTTPSQRQRERAAKGEDDELGDGAPPEWALLLLGCLLGLATGICVAAFNRGVSVCLFTELYFGVFDVNF